MNTENIYLNIKIDDIIPSQHQPRKVFNKTSLEELANSIKNYGVLNPILVKKNGEKYEIISGERRIKASILAGLTEVPARILDIDDKKITEIAMAENLQRENISPIEEAKSFDKIMKENALTEGKLSEVINKNQSIISKKLELLNLPENIQQALNERKIGERHARSLMTVEDDIKKTELLNKIINEKLTVKELDNIINSNEISDEEIENALQNITKSLNINLEEKEEKESDNMNNGNFFPNMEQNPTAMNQTNQLNQVNMQPMAQQPVTEALVNQEPVVNPIPDFSVQPENNNAATLQQPVDQPLFGPEPAQNTPQVEIPQPTPSVDINPISEPVVNPIPEAAPIVESPQMPPTPEPTSTVVQPSPVDQPLFNIAPTETPIVESTPAYDIPVESQQEVISSGVPNFEKVQEILNTNGISYKSYSNETGHCIIIEI